MYSNFIESGRFDDHDTIAPIVNHGEKLVQANITRRIVKVYLELGASFSKARPNELALPRNREVAVLAPENCVRVIQQSCTISIMFFKVAKIFPR